MRILIELPTWLGDAVMTTPAIENILLTYPNAKLTLIGSRIAIEALASNPQVIKTILLNKNFLSLYKESKKIGYFDYFISFRTSFRSKFFKFFVSSAKKYQYDKYSYKNQHQVQKYNSFICESLQFSRPPLELTLYIEKQNKSISNPIIGINPGASYGSAKRWGPQKFAEVACKLSSMYDIYIFGSPNEQDAAIEIENYLLENGVSNYKNLSGKTTISELMSYISELDLFITGDSGPMHIAASFNIPTVAIFGPTKHNETSQWMNVKSTVIKKTLSCQPCMKRTCPLGHHNCMRLIQPDEVLNAVNQVN